MLVLVVLAVVSAGFVALVLQNRKRLEIASDRERGLHRVSSAVSKRLQFRFPERSDADFFIEMASDKTAAEANGWAGNEAAVVRARFDNRRIFRDTRHNELVAFERTTKTRVGTATYSTSQIGPHGSMMIGLHVHPNFRGRGYGREIMAAAILLLQQHPGQHIYVGTRVTNLGMQRIMDQLGYEQLPKVHQFRANDGKHYPSYWYRVQD